MDERVAEAIDAEARAIGQLAPSTEEELVYLGYPPALAKACFDFFSYRVCLRTGAEIDFESATPLVGGWVRLNCEKYDRGIEVRVSDILWVVDAPFGS